MTYPDVVGTMARLPFSGLPAVTWFGTASVYRGAANADGTRVDKQSPTARSGCIFNSNRETVVLDWLTWGG